MFHRIEPVFETPHPPSDPLIPVDHLLAAYCNGVFPMASDDASGVEWFVADPRGIIDLSAFKIPSKLRRRLPRTPFELRIDTAFEDVVRGCGDREESWISETIVGSYVRLHAAGFAHSVETWLEGELAGGLYGVGIGGAFFAESMFYRVPDASKFALIGLVGILKGLDYKLLDIQMVTPTTALFGAREIGLKEYRTLLKKALQERRRFGLPERPAP